MADTRQLVLDGNQESGLLSGETTQLRLRGIPKIRMMRGSEFAPAYALPEVDDEVLVMFDSSVVSPVPKSVVALWKKAGRQPEPAVLAAIEIDASEVPDTGAEVKLLLKAGSIQKEWPLEKEGGIWKLESKLLFVYGDGSVDENPFEGVVAVDISKSGDIGFEIEGTVEIGTHKRRWGCIDVQLKDKDDGKFRTIRYGIFQGRDSGLKLIAPILGANHLQVLLDDGQDETPDSLDITRFLRPSAPVTDKSEMPLGVDPEDAQVEGTWTTPTPRTRIITEGEDDDPTFLGLLVLGENRIQIRDTYSGALVYAARFLVYDEEDTPVVGWDYGVETAKQEESAILFAANHILIDFADARKWKDVSATLYGLHMVPQGLVPEDRIVQCTPWHYLNAEEMLGWIDSLNQDLPEGVESVGLDYVSELPEAVSERFPTAFQGDFAAATQSFTNAFPDYYHHFYIHTFPAHRLIDEVRFGNAPTPSVILEGSHFLNKTFILPSCKPSITAVLNARIDNPSRKLAIFGHADALGDDAHNIALSGFRAEIAHALLIKDPDVWLIRIDGTKLAIETPWGITELQFMLKQLGYYTGAVDGIWGKGTKAASREFLKKKTLPDDVNGVLDRAARRQLISDYMDDLVPTALKAQDFHRDGSGKPALFSAGESFPLIPSDPNNAQNRRITFILKLAPPVPIVLTQTGAAAPYPAWIAPEPDAPTQGADNHNLTVGCWDSGFGNNDDFSGDNLDTPNRLMVRGRRLVRPTLIGDSSVNTHRVFRDGDLSGSIVAKQAVVKIFGPNIPAVNLVMNDTASAHGTSVMTTCAGDGVGDDFGGGARNARQVVLGTGKDVKFRPIKLLSWTQSDFVGMLARYKVMKADADIKVVTTSSDVRTFDKLTKKEQKSLIKAARAMCTAGKLFFLAACNVNPSASELGRRDVKRTEAGNQAPRRAQKRSSLTGDDQYKRNVMAVGASARALSGGAHTAGITEFPTSFTFLGDEVSVAMPGDQVRAIKSVNGGADVNNGGGPGNIFIGPISGTSFSTPMTAGVAAEMMLVNPTLQQTANMPRVVEMIEATADPLPSLALAPLASRGSYLPGAAANVDAQLVASDLAGFRRVHFWKAVLAAVNDGLPTEQKIQNPAGGGLIDATAHFDQLTARDHAATIWYGFEIRTDLADNRIFYKRKDNTYLAIEDGGAALPQSRRAMATWVRAQDLRKQGGPLNGNLLPNFPFAVGGAGVTLWFMCQFSVKREELARYAQIILFHKDIDPGIEANRRAPPISLMPLDQIPRMRNKAGITGPDQTANPALKQIVNHLEEFDDFVFHWTVKPQALDHFVLLHADGMNRSEDLQVRVCAVDTLGNLKTDFNGNIQIGHTGTPGTVAKGATIGVQINGTPAAASTAIALVNGMATFTVRVDHFHNAFRLTATDGAGHNDDGKGPEINVKPPGDLGRIQVEATHFNGTAFSAQPPRVGDRLKVTVKILDNHGHTKTNFTGKVNLKIIEGQMGIDGANPPATKRGIHVANAQADAFDFGRFTHDFIAGDRGKFEFSVFVYSTGPVLLQAVHGEFSGNSPRFEILPGALDHFDFTGPASVAPGSKQRTEIRARDAFGNLIHDFVGRVQLTAQPLAMAASAPGGVNRGLFINHSLAATDDFLDFSASDRGAKAMDWTAYTVPANNQFQIRATSGGKTSDSAQITIQAAAALASFGFEVHATQNIGVNFPVTVIARDASGNRIPNFTGAVKLSATPSANVTIAANTHNYVAGDNGQFTFLVRMNKAGTITLKAISGVVQSVSGNVTVS